MSELTCLVLNCTLKKSPAESSSDLLGWQILTALSEHDVTGSIERVVDYDARFGVTTDEGDGGLWPALREKLLAADIVIVVTPFWLGQPSSVCKLVLERLDADRTETGDEGRLLTYGKVAGIGVVGNEDGAHHLAAELCQALSEVGFTLPAGASTYWVGEAVRSVDYKDKPPSPETTVATMAANLAHLAGVLAASPYFASS